MIDYDNQEIQKIIDLIDKKIQPLIDAINKELDKIDFNIEIMQDA